MNDPVAKAKWVIETHGVTGIPALSLKPIAAHEKIMCRFEDCPDDKHLAGMLLYKGHKRKIIVNTHINNTGRHNFTFAHELGHYFLDHPLSYNRDGQTGFQCTSDDMRSKVKPREVEANRFAAELLMPECRFKQDMVGAPLDFGLINNLSSQYMVSKQACGYRVLSLTQAPCIIIYTEGTRITGNSASRAARTYHNQRLVKIPDHTAAHNAIINQWGQEEFTLCDAGKWLTRPVPGGEILECTHISREYGTAVTILKW